MTNLHGLYEVWKSGSQWKVKVRGGIKTFGTKRQADAYKWACLRP